MSVPLHPPTTADNDRESHDGSNDRVGGGDGQEVVGGDENPNASHKEGSKHPVHVPASKDDLQRKS